MTLVDIGGSVNYLLFLSGVVAYLPTTVEMNRVSYSELGISMVYRHDKIEGKPGIPYFFSSSFHERTLWFFLLAQLIIFLRSTPEL